MVLAEYPREHDTQYMYFSTRHQARLIGGYSGFIPLEKEVRLAFSEFPSPGALDRLRRFGATHVTYNCAFERNQNRCEGTFSALDESPILELVASERWRNVRASLYRFK
jgi:hypothetical protein